MGELKLYGMKAAFDEIITTAVNRGFPEWGEVFGRSRRRDRVARQAVVQRHSELTPFRHEELTPMPFALQAVAG
eukprot:gene18201-biopygen5391